MQQFFYPEDQIPDHDFIYDEETFPNIYTCTFVNAKTLQVWAFEISARVDHTAELHNFVHYLASVEARLVGYNNIGFDYPVLHFIMKNFGVSCSEIYDKAMSVIQASNRNDYSHSIYPKDWLVFQLDLYKIHHYDNANRRTSLKLLEINMGMNSVEDLPFPVGTVLTFDQMDTLLKYNYHDCWATLLFYYKTLGMIRMREELSVRFEIDMMNFNDTKIGKQYFIKKLEEAQPGSCYYYEGRKRKIRQTPRESVALRDVILPYIQFEQPEFQRIHNWLSAQVITETKGVFKDLTATVGGMEFVFGTGGLHGSIEAEELHTTETETIEDVDVKSFYPNLAIVNNLRPAHHSEIFSSIYTEVYMERTKYPKGSVENACFKLALNGVYGDSNQKFSPFYDPQYTMAITINGQLLLCVLAEQLLKVPGLRLIQANTDGITYKCPNEHLSHVRTVCTWWEGLTNLELEAEIYSRMWIKDVNNYIAEYQKNGKLKRKSAYCYGEDLSPHQDHSSQVVAKAAEAALVHGEDVSEFIYEHTILQDFMLGTKVTAGCFLVQLKEDGSDRVLPKIVRYVVTTDGESLYALRPATGPIGQYKKANGISQELYEETMERNGYAHDPAVCTKNKSKYGERREGVQAGFKVSICNDIHSLKNLNINYDYYIDRAERLVKPIKGNFNG